MFEAVWKIMSEVTTGDILHFAIAMVLAFYAGHLRYVISRLRERLDDAENLVRDHEAFIFVAETDDRPGSAVFWARANLDSYNLKWERRPNKGALRRRKPVEE